MQNDKFTTTKFWATTKRELKILAAEWEESLAKTIDILVKRELLKRMGGKNDPVREQKL